MFKEGDVLCFKYELKKQFNKGGFSSVWKATDLKAKKDFAIKIYAHEDGLDENGIEEFREEYNLVVNLNHSNIFKPLTYDIHENKPFIVMPYCQRGSASSLIGKISEKEAWKFAHDVAAGLAYLHDQNGIVHQDIKPGNILIDDDGKYMITDFGISTKLHKSVRMTLRQAKEMQNINYGCGTPEYMGPERWPSEGYIPPAKPIFASDIWSLGATLYELLTGQVPYIETGGAMQRTTKVLPVISCKCSKELKKLIYRCLSEKTWERPNAKQISVSALEQKSPVYQSINKKRWVKIIGISAVFFGVFSMALYKYNKRISIQPINPNDSILLSNVEKAVKIINIYSQNPDKYNNYAVDYTIELIKAAELHKKSLNLEVTDSVREKGEVLWKTAQSIIDEEYLFFVKSEQDYRRGGAESAADSFALRCLDIHEYVSEKYR